MDEFANLIVITKDGAGLVKGVFLLPAQGTEVAVAAAFYKHQAAARTMGSADISQLCGAGRTELYGAMPGQGFGTAQTMGWEA